MNKTLLLVTSDFLLLSMLALARFDLPSENTDEQTVEVARPAPSNSEVELIRLLEDSLEFELAARAQIKETLAQAQSQLQESSLDLAKSEQALSSAQKKLAQNTAKISELQAAQSESHIKNAQLVDENARVAAERTQLASEYAATRASLEDSQRVRIQLMEEVGQSRLEAAQLKERVRQVDQMLDQREQQLNRTFSEKEALLQRQQTLEQKLQVTLAERRLYAESLQAAKGEQARVLAHVDRLAQNPSADERLRQAEKALTIREVELKQREIELQAAMEQAQQQREQSQQLSRQLEVVLAERALLEKRLGSEQLEKAQVLEHANRLSESLSEFETGFSQVEQEVSQLGSGVMTLQNRADQIMDEIDASRPRTLSELYTRFQANRVDLKFTTMEPTLIGEMVPKNYSSQSVLVEDQDAYYVLMHTADSPFPLSKGPNAMHALSLELVLGQQRFTPQKISFLASDPRLIFIQVPSALVTASGVQPFKLATWPLRQEDSILIKNDASNFGTVQFRPVPSQPQFLKMDRPAFGNVFAEFASSRGDLAFDRGSHLIGLMADNRYAHVLGSFAESAWVAIGKQYDPEAFVSTWRTVKNRKVQN